MDNEPEKMTKYRQLNHAYKTTVEATKELREALNRYYERSPELFPKSPMNMGASESLRMALAISNLLFDQIYVSNLMDEAIPQYGEEDATNI